MDQWFIQQDEGYEDLGPLGPSELLELVRNGEVIADTLLRKDDDSAWFVAKDVGGLFEAAMRPTIEYFCPQCEAEVSEPPVICHKCGRKIQEGITKITENAILDPAEQSLREQAGGSVKRSLQDKRHSPEKDDDER